MFFLRMPRRARRGHRYVRARPCRYDQRNGSTVFEALSKIETEHFWSVVRNELIVGLANKFFPQARRYLEIGCGNGAVLRAIAASRLEAPGRLRIAPTRLTYARKRLPSGVELCRWMHATFRPWGFSISSARLT
jgi:ubiquinone/menaquinone biosynthesis C-methylase UbiE